MQTTDNIQVEDTKEDEIDFIYPPEGNTLVEMVEYIISHKALPANLPTNLATIQSSEEMPRHLVPKEIYCHKRPGKVPLSEPIILHRRAKIVTVTGVVDGRLHCI